MHFIPQWLSGEESACNAGDTGDVVQSLGREDSLEEGMATHSSILVENPMDRGAWRATVHGVAKSWARLKQPSTDACMHPSQRLACCLEESECPHWMGLS